MKRFLALAILLQLITTSALAFVAHEWGTFTSLVGSNGETQDGMYHEDEPLPDFVHGFGETQSPFFPPPFEPDECFNMKVCFSPVVFDNNIISQKMETPVIYFYGDRAQRVSVNVEFPEGIITDTFPAPITSSPKNTEDLIIANGKARFDVDLMPLTGLRPPEVEAGNIYGHARKVNSLMIKTNNEVEKFIFYRGLGRFQPQMTIRSYGENFVFRTTKESQPLSAFLVFKGLGKPHMLPVIDKDGNSPFHHFIKGDQGRYNQFTIPDEKIRELKQGYGEGIQVGGDPFDTLEEALVAHGLKKDEAAAMVNTWANGYFKTPGLRMLYILPKPEVDEILPLTMSPAPSKMERVFVARLEIMLEKEELDLVSQIMADKESFDVTSLGRLAEPMLRRAQEVYHEQHLMIQPDLPNFEYGLFEVFNQLVEQSKAQNSTGAVTH